MYIKGWMLAGLLVLPLAGAGPAAVAYADDGEVKLERGEERLGRAVEMIVHGKYAEAERTLREALRADPELREAHYNLGVALRAQGKNDEAVAELDYAEEQYARADAANRAKCLYGAALAREARGDRDAWDAYLTFARPLKVEQANVQIAKEHREALNGAGVGARVKVPGTMQKASR